MIIKYQASNTELTNIHIAELHAQEEIEGFNLAWLVRVLARETMEGFRFRIQILSDIMDAAKDYTKSKTKLKLDILTDLIRQFTDPDCLDCGQPIPPNSDCQFGCMPNNLKLFIICSTCADKRDKKEKEEKPKKARKKKKEEKGIEWPSEISIDAFKDK